MSDACLADRLGGLVQLTPAERDVLARLEQRERVLRRGATLVREKERHSDLFILTRGTMMSYVLLHDGSRQILRFLFRGDLPGWSALAYSHSPDTISALTEAVVCPIDRGLLAGLFVDHPRLAALMLALSQIERVTLTDRLAALGRTPARARVAAVLLEIRDRICPAGDGTPPSFVLGLTQEEIGDATGLTAVHVNRMLRRLEEDGLVARNGGRVTLLREAALIKAANYVDRLAGLDLSWLPPAR